MDERSIEFSTLSDRISAQTDAYIETSVAFIKVIESIAYMKERQNDIHGITQATNDMAHALLLHQQESIAALKDIQDAVEVSSVQVTANIAQISNIKSHLDKFIMFLGSLAVLAMILGLLVGTKVISISWLNH